MGHNHQLEADMVIQYSIVGLVLLAACIWIIWKLVRKNKKKSNSSCCGCAIADSCKKVQKYKR